jgi:hypothetical protein
MRFAGCVVVLYTPSVIVFYAGDNDITYTHVGPGILNGHSRFIAWVRDKRPLDA